MRKLSTAIIALLFFQVAIAQQKDMTMQDAMINARTTLAPENLKGLQFIKGTNDYAYMKKINGTDGWVTGNFKSGEEKPFFNLAQLNEKLRAASLDTFATLPSMQLNKDSWIFSLKGQRIALNPNTNTYKVLISKSQSSKENVEESSDGYVAYVDNFNLFVSKDNEVQKVTEDGSKDIVYASSVHQSEFGITKGTFWSNNGKQLAFYRMDQSMVPDYPIIDWTQRPAKVENVRYPMAGDKSHHVTVGVYHAVNKTTTWIRTTGPAEQYLTNIAWSPDDKFIYIVILNRAQDHFWVNQYDAATGNFVRTLFEEEDSKYAEPLHPMLFVKNNPNQFIWQSRRDGWNHLYLYNINGTLIRQLTKGSWEVTDVKGFDEKGSMLYYVSTEVSPISKNLYQLSLKNGNRKMITQGNFVHNTSVSSDGNYVIDNFSGPQNPRTVLLTETRTGKSKTLLQAPNPLTAYNLGEMSIFTIKNQEGTDLYCRMFKPASFDATKKYPVIVYWYGGPHAQMILNSWNGGAGDYWFQYMAERGYVVFTLDTRGSSNRGKAFEQAIFRKAGDAQMEDMMTAVNYLQQLSFTDKDRMGLFGWSYGGFMTTSFMLKHPGIFKTAVAGGPVIDWKYYEIMYTERYMDTPQENPEGFDNTNLVKQVDKLKGNLLLIHGMQDNVVLQQHSVLFVKAAVDKGVQVDYMIYPGHEHNVLGKDRAHLYQKVTDYFMQHLQ
ncbi:MAG: DPP IV N-terminal domain-containing protein [Ferruginibacter sp.]